MDTFQDRLKTIMKGMTQAEFASKIGIHVSTIATWSTHLPSGDILLRIAQTFDVDLAWLVTGEEGRSGIVNERGEDYAASVTCRAEKAGPFKLSDALTMAARVLESDTTYALALYLNIQHFDRAIQAETRIEELERLNQAQGKDIVDLKKRLAALEEKLGKGNPGGPGAGSKRSAAM